MLLKTITQMLDQKQFGFGCWTVNYFVIRSWNFREINGAIARDLRIYYFWLQVEMELIYDNYLKKKVVVSK